MGKLWEMFHGQANMESTTALVASWGSIWQQEILQVTLSPAVSTFPWMASMGQACPSLGTYYLRSSTVTSTGSSSRRRQTASTAGHLLDDLMNVSCQIAHSVNTRLVTDCIFCKHKAHVSFKSLNSPAPMQCPAHSKGWIFNKWMNQHQWTCLGKCPTNQGSTYAC